MLKELLSKKTVLSCQDINIRDPFVLFENGKYYMYGTRGKNFGKKTGGFDVYVSTDLKNWSEPIECFNSEKYNMNTNVNWAPEVHKYKDGYFMFATFTKPNGLRGTYILKSNPSSSKISFLLGDLLPKIIIIYLRFYQVVLELYHKLIFLFLNQGTHHQLIPSPK